MEARAVVVASDLRPNASELDHSWSLRLLPPNLLLRHVRSFTSIRLSQSSVMPATSSSISSLQSKIWNGSLAVEIRLAASDCRTYDGSEPYLIQYPRLSYLAFLLPRLHTFFAPSLINPEVSSFDAWLSFEDVPLKWHCPLGLLYDLFSGAEPADMDPPGQGESVAASQATVEASTGQVPIPWKLTIHYTDFPYDQLIQLDPEGLTMRDTFINSVKEADYVRNGTARTVMSLSKEDSDNLWLSVQKRKSKQHSLYAHLLMCDIRRSATISCREQQASQPTWNGASSCPSQDLPTKFGRL